MSTESNKPQVCQPTQVLEKKPRPPKSRNQKFQESLHKILKKLPVGARVLKTALAMVISMSIGTVFGIGTGFTATPAMWGMQPTVGDSIESSKKMLKMQILSFIPVFALGLTMGPNMLSIFIGVILVFQMAIKLKLTGQTMIGVVTVIFILTSPPEIFLKQALLRSFGIFIGLTTAILVNRLIAPPQYRTMMVQQGIKLNLLLMEEFCAAIKQYMQGDKPEADYKKSRLTMMSRELAKFDSLFNRFSNEEVDIWREEAEPVPIDPLDWDSSHAAEVRFFAEYRELSHGLIVRTKETWSLAEEKVRRLYRWRNMESTELDQAVYGLVEEGLDRLLECNVELNNKVLGGPPQPFTDPHIWRQMDDLLTKWHADSTQSRNDLHSLVEISLITYRVRWSIKHILDMLIMEPCEMEVLSFEESAS